MGSVISQPTIAIHALFLYHRARSTSAEFKMYDPSFDCVALFAFSFYPRSPLQLAYSPSFVLLSVPSTPCSLDQAKHRSVIWHDASSGWLKPDQLLAKTSHADGVTGDNAARTQCITRTFDHCPAATTCIRFALDVTSIFWFFRCQNALSF